MLAECAGKFKFFNLGVGSTGASGAGAPIIFFEHVSNNNNNESTKVQNPRRMCSMVSDGVMTNCT